VRVKRFENSVCLLDRSSKWPSSAWANWRHDPYSGPSRQGFAITLLDRQNRPVNVSPTIVGETMGTGMMNAASGLGAGA